MKQVKQTVKRGIQRGFTLIELVVVVAVVAVLIAVVAPNVAGSKDGANSTLLLKSAQDAANNWMLISQACGTTTDAAASPVMAATKTVADVVFGGSANVAAAYTACYNQSRVRPMVDVGQPNGTGWTVAGFGVSFSGGGTVPLQAAYSAVPDALTLMLAQHYTPSLSALAASDTTSSVVRYSTASGGTRTVNVLRPIN